MAKTPKQDNHLLCLLMQLPLIKTNVELGLKIQEVEKDHKRRRREKKSMIRRWKATWAVSSTFEGKKPERLRHQRGADLILIIRAHSTQETTQTLSKCYFTF